MDIESDIEFVFLGVFASSHFTLMNQNASRQHEDRSCGSVLADNPRKHERQAHRLFHGAIALKLGAQPESLGTAATPPAEDIFTMPVDLEGCRLTIECHIQLE
jgi:hypothetical protein